MPWTEYAIAMLLFSGVSMLLLYVIERMQHVLPWNPQHFANVGTDLAFNTAASFTTNTNWQNYVPEVTMSYFTQMAGLAYHNFASAAVGIALAIAVIRGIARRESKTIGNFWVDLDALLSVGSAAGVPGDCAVLRFAGRDPESQALRPRRKLLNPQTVQTTGTDGKTTTQTVTEQVIAARSLRLAGSHQDLRHQWRRLSSTPTARIPSKIPLRSRISFSWF